MHKDNGKRNLNVLLHHRIFATREDFRGSARPYRAVTVRERPLAAFAISGLQLRSNVLLHSRIFATREDFRSGARQYRAATVRKRPLAAFAISGLQLRSNVGRSPRTAADALVGLPLWSKTIQRFTKFYDIKANVFRASRF